MKNREFYTLVTGALLIFSLLVYAISTATRSDMRHLNSPSSTCISQGGIPINSEWTGTMMRCEFKK